MVLGTVYRCPECQNPTMGCVHDRPCIDCLVKSSCQVCYGFGINASTMKSSLTVMGPDSRSVNDHLSQTGQK